ncbi:MFS transporter [Candidatus Woesearchaeota archaeon]|nr:MFS transporter [Candidatus Woesearchaeota archaeon]
MQRPLKYNIPLFIIWKATRSGLFWLPVFTLFYIDFGMSYTQIMLLPLLTGGLQILLEVPSGILADLWGRKYVLFLGSALWTASFYFFLIANNMADILVSVALFGMALAFLSGTDSAMLYDTLKALKREKEYKKIAGKALAYQLGVMAICGLIGGPLTAHGGYSATLVAVLCVSSLTTFLAIFMVEPPHHKKSTDRHFFKHLKEATIFTTQHPRVRSLILYSGLLMGIMIISHKLLQPALINAGVSLTGLGPVYFIWLLIGAVGALKADAIEKFIGKKYALILIPAFMVLNFVPLVFYGGMGIIVILALSEFTWGFILPVVEDYINHYVASSHRATVLSLGGFMQSIAIFICAPLIGILADAYGLEIAFLGLTILSALGLFLIPSILKKTTSSRSSA